MKQNTVLPKGLDLLLNASEDALQVVFADDGRFLCGEEWHLPHMATEMLAPALESLLHRLQIQVSSLRRIACAHGPGSFTGIRLVLTTAMVLRRIGHMPLAPLQGLELLGYELCLSHRISTGTLFWVITHARRDLVHAQAFRVVAPLRFQPISPLSLLAPSALLPKLSANDVLCGSALSRYPQLFEREAQEKNQRLVPDVRVGFDALVLAGSLAEYQDHDLEPLYIRPCDALDNLERLAARQGIPGEEALSRYSHMVNRIPESSI
ncbi:MAG: tRNA (adenosine(37)-N6)-threonylcarbamoyltransferase complex dimerization subunit type 1 TsaB [Desulfovibrio sp.]|nr:tRNA (adenosine(37)-N6)-threonylcarbamoyltransferase complex dimerization subunit type 1 TsaB [Desulfovibrio sp.]